MDKLNVAYKDKITKAITLAILEASSDNDGAVVLGSSEIARACLEQIAYFAATSGECQNPAQMHKLCNLVAQQLYQSIVRTKQEINKAENPIVGVSN